MGSKIVIIGGGIAGLTAAVALARMGLAAEVYEQAPALEEVGAGVGLWPNAMAALEPIGLSGKVAQLAAPVSRQGLMRPDGTWLLCIPGDLMARRWGSGFVAVHRAELQQLLAAELDPAVIHLGARCTGFDDSGQTVTARFADGREVRADVLVAADGVHSAVRARLLGPAPLRYRGYTAVRSITPAGSVPLPGDSMEIWGRGARFGLAPTSGGRIIWWATWNAAAGKRRQRHRRAPAYALRRLARSCPCHHRSHPARLPDPERHIRPPAGPDLGPRAGRAGRRRRPPDDSRPRAGRLPGDRRRHHARRLPRGLPRHPGGIAGIPEAPAAQRRHDNADLAGHRRRGPVERALDLRRPRHPDAGHPPAPATAPARPRPRRRPGGQPMGGTA